MLKTRGFSLFRVKIGAEYEKRFAEYSEIGSIQHAELELSVYLNSQIHDSNEVAPIKKQIQSNSARSKTQKIKLRGQFSLIQHETYTELRTSREKVFWFQFSTLNSNSNAFWVFDSKKKSRIVFKGKDLKQFSAERNAESGSLRRENLSYSAQKQALNCELQR